MLSPSHCAILISSFKHQTRFRPQMSLRGLHIEGCSIPSPGWHVPPEAAMLRCSPPLVLSSMERCAPARSEEGYLKRGLRRGTRPFPQGRQLSYPRPCPHAAFPSPGRSNRCPMGIASDVPALPLVANSVIPQRFFGSLCASERPSFLCLCSFSDRCSLRKFPTLVQSLRWPTRGRHRRLRHHRQR